MGYTKKILANHNEQLSTLNVLQGLSFVNDIKSRFRKQTKIKRKKRQTLSILPFDLVSFLISERTPFSSAGWFVPLLNQYGFDHTSIEPFDQMAPTTQVKTIWYNGYHPKKPKQKSQNHSSRLLMQSNWEFPKKFGIRWMQCRIR